MAIPQKLAITNDKGETKMVMLKGEKKEEIMEELREACLKKFQVKKKKANVKFLVQGGECLENSEMLCKALMEQKQIMFKIT